VSIKLLRGHAKIKEMFVGIKLSLLKLEIPFVNIGLKKISVLY
jgi:hypothetical protein